MEQNSGELSPGSYSVEEINPDGLWELDSVVCNSSLGGTEDNTSIDLEENEVVTCIFSSVKLAGGGGSNGGGGGGSATPSTSGSEGEVLDNKQQNQSC